MDRRNFIKKGCSACVAVAGMGIALQSCTSALPVVQSAAKDHKLTVPIAEFATQMTNMIRVENNSLGDDILLIKNETGGYTALLMKCTHEGFGLSATGTKLICNAHGSQFDLAGNVLKSPALKPLKEFKVTTTTNNVIIHLI